MVVKGSSCGHGDQVVVQDPRRTSAVKYLFSSKANTAAVTRRRRTALSMATAPSCPGHTAAIGSMSILIEAKADLHARDDRGKAAVDYAVL